MSKKIVTIDIKQAGQPRRYADHIFEAEISVEAQGVMKENFLYTLNENLVRGITKLLVRNFEDNPQDPWAPRLEVCKPLDDKKQKWLVKVVEEYTD